MDFTNPSSLSSFGRQVNDPVVAHDKYEPEKKTANLTIDRIDSVYSKYSGQNSRDMKLASSAIFPNNNIN